MPLRQVELARACMRGVNTRCTFPFGCSWCSRVTHPSTLVLTVLQSNRNIGGTIVDLPLVRFQLRQEEIEMAVDITNSPIRILST